jgi:hypothetical protein
MMFVGNIPSTVDFSKTESNSRSATRNMQGRMPKGHGIANAEF